MSDLVSNPDTYRQALDARIRIWSDKYHFADPGPALVIFLLRLSVQQIIILKPIQ
jgi:hypothetical protein